MKAVVTGAITGSTLVFTPIQNDAGQYPSTGITTAGLKVWLVSEWTINQVTAQF
jgi:hypothetical protein